MADETKVTGPETPGPPETQTEPEQTPGEPLVNETAGTPGEPSEKGQAETSAQEKEGQPGKVIDITNKVAGMSGAEDREPWEMTQAELEAQKKDSRSRRPKKTEEKAGPAGRSGKVRASRDKAAPAKQPREKSSQSKARGGKAGPGGDIGSVGPPATETVTEPKEPPRPVAEGQIVYLKLSEVHPFHTFRAHPFHVEDDKAMLALADTIKEHGVLTPGIVRPEKDGSGYECIAGHRRHRGSELAGLTEMPFIVRSMTDHEAVQEMKNSNKQRGPMLPMELARLLDLELEDLKHQGTQIKDAAPGEAGKRSSEIVGKLHGMSYKKVTDYVRLNSLVPELQAKVDGILDEHGERKPQLGFTPAVHLSYVRPKNQQLIAVSIDSNEKSLSVAQAKRLRELDGKNLLNGDVIDGILCEETKEELKVIINEAELKQYFSPTMPPRQMKDQIMALLDEWKEKQPPEKKAPEQSAER